MEVAGPISVTAGGVTINGGLTLGGSTSITGTLAVKAGSLSLTTSTSDAFYGSGLNGASNVLLGRLPAGVSASNAFVAYEGSNLLFQVRHRPTWLACS